MFVVVGRQVGLDRIADRRSDDRRFTDGLPVATTAEDRRLDRRIDRVDHVDRALEQAVDPQDHFDPAVPLPVLVAVVGGNRSGVCHPDRGEPAGRDPAEIDQPPNDGRGSRRRQLPVGDPPATGRHVVGVTLDVDRIVDQLEYFARGDQHGVAVDSEVGRTAPEQHPAVVADDDAPLVDVDGDEGRRPELDELGLEEITDLFDVLGSDRTLALEVVLTLGDLVAQLLGRDRRQPHGEGDAVAGGEDAVCLLAHGVGDTEGGDHADLEVVELRLVDEREGEQHDEEGEEEGHGVGVALHP